MDAKRDGRMQCLPFEIVVKISLTLSSSGLHAAASESGSAVSLCLSLRIEH